MRRLKKQGTPFWRSSAIVVLMVLMTASWGCASRMQAGSSRPVKSKPIVVIAQSSMERYAGTIVGIVPFHAPSEALSAVPEVTGLYHEHLLQQGLFRQIKRMPRAAQNRGEALWWARQEGCDLILDGSLDYLLDGSGAMPTQLRLSVRLVDVRSGQTAWELKQEAYSEPGWDVDLYWTTLSGAPAQRYRVLAGALADQLAKFLAEPLIKKEQEKKKSTKKKSGL